MPGKGTSSQKNAPRPKKIGDTSNTRVLITVAYIGAAATIFAALVSAVIPLFAGDKAAVEDSPTAVPTQIPVQTATLFVPTVTSAPLSQAPNEIVDDRGVTMMLVPAGEFLMGSNHGEIDEQPVHKVYLASFYMDKYEVTNAQYRVCVSVKACNPPGDVTYYQNAGYSDHPVTFVDWYMAEAYCSWRDARLPTEAEWEKAARGSTDVMYPWGDAIDCSYANYRGVNGYCVGDSSPVGGYEIGKSVFGIYDLAGNALEWVSSAYADYPYDPNDGREGLNISSMRVIRGGSWNNRGIEVRATVRAWAIPSRAEFDFGFRCAKDAP